MTRKILGLLFMALCCQQMMHAQEEVVCDDDREEAQETQAPCYIPERCCRYHHRWKEDGFLERQYQDSLWPSRRDDELSDQLSR